MPAVDAALAMAPHPGSGDLLITKGKTTHAQSGTGAFRIECRPSHMANDDPIVYPGRPGAAHHHTFFGNTSTNARTRLGAATVAGHRTDPGEVAVAGNSTCPGGIANRSSYWVPSMIDTAGHAPLVPWQTIIYYKGGYKVADRLITAPPAGLRFIAGNAAATSAQPDPAPYHRLQSYSCYDRAGKQVGYGKAIPLCPTGGDLVSAVSYPQCWDGVHLDSPDHRSHMAYSSGYRNTPTPGCPASHPVAIPQITIHTHYRVTTEAGTKDWRLSSDNYPATGYNGGYSSHADWVNGWDPKIMNRLLAACINPGKDCGGPDLQDGTLLAKVKPAPSTPAPRPSATPSPTHTMNHLMPLVDTTLAMAPKPGSGESLITKGSMNHAQSGTGAFRIECRPSHMSNDDPIVYPGRQGAAHHHTFFGNTGINSRSDLGADTVTGHRTDPGDVAGSGNSTCPGGIANRTGYWVPSMIDTTSHAPLVPWQTIIYYKGGYRVPDKLIVAPPAGLRMISGNATATAAQPDPSRWVHPLDYHCYSQGKQVAQGRSIPACPQGGDLISSIGFPQCWDGVHLDSPDHSSHMAHSVSGLKGGPTPGCPASHPVAIPQISVNVHYRVTSAEGTKNWRLSSDGYPVQGYNGGFSQHSDWVNGWDPKIMDLLIKNCINPGKDCGGPDLRNGTVLATVPR